MTTPGLKTLENCAQATGCAFGFEESDLDVRYVAPVRPGRLVALFVAVGGSAIALAHHFGLTSVVTSLGGWRPSV